MPLKMSAVPFTGTKRTLIVASVVAVVSALALIHTLAQTDCERCKAAKKPSVWLWGSYKVCIQPGDFSGDQMLAINEGGKYWENHLHPEYANLTLNFEVKDVSSSDCQMKVYASAECGGIACAAAYPDGNGSYIKVTSYPIALYDFNKFAELAGHEFGHIVGFENQTDSYCQGKSIMYEGSDIGYLPIPWLCSDLYAVADKYSNVHETYDEYTEPSSEMEDCYDVYEVTYRWARTSGGYTFMYATYRFLGVDCDPLEDEGENESALPAVAATCPMSVL